MSLLTVPQAAKQSGLSKSFLYELIREGTIPHVRMKRQIRVEFHEILNWVKLNSSRKYIPAKRHNAKMREMRKNRDHASPK